MASIAPPAHTRRKGTTTDNWITPKVLIDRLGPFDLDPCGADPRPWDCATVTLTKKDAGLSKDWGSYRSFQGLHSPLVFANPPYGRQTGLWLAKLAEHGNGIALVFARTDTKKFFDHVYFKAAGILFIKGRLCFCRPDGSSTRAGRNSGGPSCLIAYGPVAWRRLKDAQDLGAFVTLEH